MGVNATSDIYAMVYCGNGIVLLGDSSQHVWRSDCAFKTDETASASARKGTTAVIYMDVDMVKIPASNNPETVTLGTFPALGFDDTSDEYVNFEVCLPDGIDTSKPIVVSVSVAPAVAQSAGSIFTFGIEYAFVADGEDATPATTTRIENIAVSITAEVLKVSTGITVPAAEFSDGDRVGIKLFRDADASEDGATDDRNGDADLVSVCLSYTRKY